MTVVPAAALLVLELALRLFGYGCPTGFLLDVPGRDACVANERFGWRFFPSRIARTPLLFSFPAKKAPKTYRIFILGGSAAAGTPDPAFNFGRPLQAMLRERCPAARFEVVNAAMTAINSHVARLIARDCAAHQPDLFVVYMGNNEVVGPYGPGTVFAGFSPSLSTIRASLYVRSTGTGQLMGDLLRSFGGKEQAGGWRGMEMFSGNRVPVDDPRLEKVYAHFRANLADICEAARGAGAKVILCTVGTNLRQCAPFASMHRAGLGAADKAEFKALYDAGVSLEAAGKHDQAIEKYSRAAAIDGRFAELHFRMARCCLSSGRAEEAREHFRLARDTDALRFRADSRVNEAVRQTAAAQAARGVHLVDFDKLLQADPATPHGIPGQERFYEHVHLRFEGSYALAAAVFRQVVRLLPTSVTAGAPAPPEPPAIDRCAELVAWTAWSRYKDNEAIATMVRRPPFTGQLDHAQDTARRQQLLAKLRNAVSTEVLRQTLQTYRQAVRRDGDDPLLRDSFAEFLHANGKYVEAAENWQAVVRLFPGHSRPACNLGAALAEQGKLDEAIQLYRKSLGIWPDSPGACTNLASALKRQGKLDEAAAWLGKALAADPGCARAHVGLGEVRFAKGLYADAERHFAEALRIEPGLPEAHKGLALTLLRRKDIPAAAQHLKEMLEAKPTAPAHYDLANLLAKQGKTAEAVQHLREALRLDPNLAPAHTSLGMALEELGRADQAHGHYAEALRLAPGDTTARGKLALLLLRRGSYDQAVHHYRQLLQAQPDRVDALYNISFALVSLSQYGQAATYLARAVQQKPTPQGHHDLAALLSRQGRSRTAIAHYRQALRMQPGWPPAEAGLAWELATAAEGELRDPAEAVKLAASACQQTGHKNARFLDILAAALAAEGQFARAVDTAEEAIPLAPAATNERLAKQLQERIALYRAHKPYRQGRTATAPAPARP